MVPPTVLVSSTTEQPQKEIIQEELGDAVNVVFLSELQDARRNSAIEGASFFLSWDPTHEFREEEIHLFSGDQTIQLLSAGVDFLSFEKLPPEMKILNNAGAYADPIAEHVLGLYLALSKRLLIEHKNMMEGNFNHSTKNRWVKGSVCGIFGFGAIGAASARILQAIGVEIMGINRSGTTNEDIEFIGGPDEFNYMLQECDGLILSAPLTSETRGIISSDELEQMKDNAMLINVARGNLIDQGDLYNHLRKNPKFQAGLEAWWNEPNLHSGFELDYPFFDLPNVLACPHNSASVPDIGEIRVRHAARNIKRAVTTRETRNVVDRHLGY